jgi:amino acid efflux transporter
MRPPPSARLQTDGNELPQLRKIITLPHAVALYAGAVIGAGVLILPGVAASAAGPASILAWTFDGLAGIPLALALAALSARFPDAGGVAAYSTRAFGRAAGAVVGWFYFVSAAVAQALVTLTGAHYLAGAAGWGRTGTILVATALLAAAVASNLGGLRVSGRIQLVLAASVAFVLLSAAAAGVARIDLHAFRPFAPHGWTAVGQTAILLFFAFFGWEAITHLSAEFRDPARDVRRATVITVVGVTSLYLSVAFVVVASHTYGGPARDRTAVAYLLGGGLGVNAARAAALAAVLITLATANAFVGATSRLGYALGRDGAAPALLGRLNQSGVPTPAILVVGAIAAAGLLLAYVAQLGAEDFLIVPNSLVVVVYTTGMAAGVRLLEGRERLYAACAGLLCLLVLPFLGVSVLIPLAVAAVALLYRWLAQRRSGRG